MLCVRKRDKGPRLAEGCMELFKGIFQRTAFLSHSSDQPEAPAHTVGRAKAQDRLRSDLCPGISPRVMRDEFRGIPGWIFSSTPLYLVVLSGILICKSVQNLMHC